MNTGCVIKKKKNPVHSCPVWPSAPLLSCFICPPAAPSRCCTAPGTWRYTTAAPHECCAASKSLRLPAPFWCVNQSRTRPTSTRRWTAGPSWADTAWTWSTPTATTGRRTHAHSRIQLDAGPRTRVKWEEGKLIKGDCISVSLVFYQLIFLKKKSF